VAVLAPRGARAEGAVEAIVGLGITIANDSESDGRGTGLFLGGEWTGRMNSWFSPRVHGGLVVTRPDGGSCGAQIRPCEINTQAAFAGAKVRLMAPFPYVGPFIEIGLGSSVGAFRTLEAKTHDVRHHGEPNKGGPGVPRPFRRGLPG
jgi:hypothetical protein